MGVNVQSFGEFKSSQIANAASERNILERYVVTDSPTGYKGPRTKLETHRILKYLQAVGLKIFPRTDMISYATNKAFDLRAKQNLQDCSLFVGYSGSCLSSLQAAKANGGFTMVYRGAPHGSFFQSTVNDELQADGFEGVLRSTPRMTAREQSEYEAADLLWVPSEFTKESLVENGISSERIEVFPYGIDMGKFEPERIETDEFIVLYVGGVTPEKGVHVLLEAFDEFDAPNASLVLVGKRDKRLRRTIEHTENASAVGWVDRTELAKWYQRANVFAFPSLADGYPSTVIEAIACGCPVIITNRTGTREFVERHDAGTVVPPRDPEALRDALREFHGSTDLQRQRGNNGVAGIETESLALAERIELMAGFLSQFTEGASGDAVRETGLQD